MGYLDSMLVTVLLVTVQNDVVSHAETFPHCQMVEKGRLAERVTHLHHCDICVGGNLTGR